MYPPEDVIQMFKSTMEGLEVRESRVAAWSKMKVRGPFLKKGFKIREGVIIGIYGGKLTVGIGPYVLQLEYEDEENFRVDSEGTDDGFRIFGMMNEDIHMGEVDAHLKEMGMIQAAQNMVGPCEILTEYGDEYDWDEIKWMSYISLKEEMAAKESWVGGMKAKNMKEARRGNRLEKYKTKVIDGGLENEGLHSTTQGSEPSTLEMMLTSGASMEQFCFGVFGSGRKEYENINIGREGKRTSGEKRYAQQCLSEETITFDFKEVRRVNSNVNSTCHMIN